MGQNSNNLNKIQPLQDKAVRIINFKPDNHNVEELYKQDKILKVTDYIKLLNVLFVRDVLLNSSIPPFQNFFTKSVNVHQHNTRHAQQNSVTLSQRISVFYGIKSIQHQAATTWNQFQNEVNGS